MRRKQRNDEAQVNLTPMLDIVFIMLIFFIVTATFVQESGLDANAAPPGPTPPTDDGVVVRIDANNRIFLLSGDTRLIDIRRVRANLERAHAENPAAPVVIQAADTADTGIVVTVYDEALAVDRNMAISIARWN